jgi:CRISPR-associated protein Cas1
LVVQDPRAGVRLSGDQLLIEQEGVVEARARIGELSQLVLMGGARCTPAALHRCLDEGIPVLHMSGTGWFYGITRGMDHRNIELRLAQFSAAQDSHRSLEIARALIEAKILNSRVLLRRNGSPSPNELALLEALARRSTEARDADTLLGLEGTAAKIYYGGFPGMLKVDDADRPVFDFERRNRRPPADPMNALLSFVNALLTKDWTITLFAVGLDPLLGFYHRPRFGKPALALDMMEAFRPVIAESVTINVVNNGEVGPDDFQGIPGGVLLRPAARKQVIAAYERRLAQELLHPVFGYRCTYRRIFELEARLLARHLLGEIPEYRPLRVR